MGSAAFSPELVFICHVSHCAVASRPSHQERHSSLPVCLPVCAYLAAVAWLHSLGYFHFDRGLGARPAAGCLAIYLVASQPCPLFPIDLVAACMATIIHWTVVSGPCLAPRVYVSLLYSLLCPRVDVVPGVYIHVHSGVHAWFSVRCLPVVYQRRCACGVLGGVCVRRRFWEVCVLSVGVCSPKCTCTYSVYPGVYEWLASPGTRCRFAV